MISLRFNFDKTPAHMLTLKSDYASNEQNINSLLSHNITVKHIIL